MVNTEVELNRDYPPTSQKHFNAERTKYCVTKSNKTHSGKYPKIHALDYQEFPPDVTAAEESSRSDRYKYINRLLEPSRRDTESNRKVGICRR